jgi:hypothetical protein
MRHDDQGEPAEAEAEDQAEPGDDDAFGQDEQEGVARRSAPIARSMASVCSRCRRPSESVVTMMQIVATIARPRTSGAVRRKLHPASVR